MTDPRRRRAGLVPTSLLLPVLSTGCGGGDARVSEGERIPEGAERIVNPAEGRWGPEERWGLTEELRIGSLRGDGADVWGTVASLVVDPGGRLFVLDSQASEIRVFSPDGEHDRTFGREGAGPGEIDLGVALLLPPEGDLWVHDARNQRFSVFDTAGTYLRSHPILSTRFLQGHRFATDGTFLELVGVDRGGQSEVVLVRGRVTGDGALRPVDTLPLPALPEVETTILRMAQGGRMTIRSRTLPFLPEAHRVLDPRGFVWTTAVDGSYRLIQHDLTGRAVRVVERAYEPVPVGAEERAEALEALEGAEFDEDRVPDVHPPFEEVHVAESGHLWVWRRAGPDRMAWDVFGPEGRYLGEVESPYDEGRFRLLAVRPGAVYGVWRDELDVTYVVRLGVETPVA